MATTAQQHGHEGAKPAKRKPVFTKVDQLKPGTSGHTLVVKVVSSNTVLQKGHAASTYLRHTRVAECLVGDDTASIVFTARNEQVYLAVIQINASVINELSKLTVDLLRPDATVILRNAKIDMFRGCMRLAVDKWGRVEVTEPADLVVNEENNLSMVEYELVNVGEE
ncbi:hypothetical protein B296_00042770 [Ensete ventricosum]|uniref:Single-stranded DNA binding protein Ssb-like OB fold domain-containing protein n=1 Tax=Ensete ventricosum TaxID=4639 RepID=A0A426Y648_ENSVE|nr:hypothetical protein B296_00042770 [Ensete ventricosum]